MSDLLNRALHDLKAGRMILLSDDEGRENEADLVCAAEFATPENINFMIKQGGGLICLTMDPSEAARLGVEPMVQRHNTSPFGTNFGVSIEARTGVTTGISAQDRSHTIVTATDPSTTGAHFSRPGHVFPLVARPWGVMERGGQTEGSVDLCRLAGLRPLGVICEVLGEDGTAMRGEELEQFAEKHQLVKINIQKILERRYQTELFVEVTDEAELPTSSGMFCTRGIKNLVDGTEHMVIYKGIPKDDMLVRIHSMCLTGDAIGSLRCDCRDQLHASLAKINAEGSGAVVYLQQEGRGIGLFNKLKAYVLQDNGMDTVEANLALGLAADGREFGIAAQVLRYWGIKSVRLLTNNPAKIDGLRRWGNINASRESLIVVSGDRVEKYLHDKQAKMGHLL